MVQVMVVFCLTIIFCATALPQYGYEKHHTHSQQPQSKFDGGQQRGIGGEPQDGFGDGPHQGGAYNGGYGHVQYGVHRGGYQEYGY